jgi:hypothetical protein
MFHVEHRGGRARSVEGRQRDATARNPCCFGWARGKPLAGLRRPSREPDMLPSGWAHAVHRSALSWTGASGGGRASRLLWCRMRLRPRAGGCSVPVAVHRASSRTGTTPCLALRMKGAERRRFSRRSAVEGWQPSGLPCVPARIASTRCSMRAGFMRRTPNRLHGPHTAGRVRGIRPVRASPARAYKREASPSSPIAALPPWPSTASGAMLARQHPSKTLRVTPAWTTEGGRAVMVV